MLATILHPYEVERFQLRHLKKLLKKNDLSELQVINEKDFDEIVENFALNDEEVDFSKDEGDRKLQ